jgi:hypothetical protein
LWQSFQQAASYSITIGKTVIRVVNGLASWPGLFSELGIESSVIAALARVLQKLGAHALEAQDPAVRVLFLFFQS